MTLTPSSHSAFSFSSSFSTSAIALKKGGKEKKSPAKADKPAKGDKGGKGKGKKDEGEDEAGGLTPEEIDAVVEKATARMDKSLEWAKTSVFDGVERGRGRVTPGESGCKSVAVAATL
jgi:ribosome recycling factor